MRIVYAETMAAAVGEFMDALNVEEIVRYEWGTDRGADAPAEKEAQYYRMALRVEAAVRQQLPGRSTGG